MRVSGKLWAGLVAFAVVAVVVAIGALRTGGDEAAPSVDGAARLAELGQVPLLPQRVDRKDYRRSAFGEAWTDDTNAVDGRNGCDTRNDVLNRDLADKTYVAIRSCPRAVATGELTSPYSGKFVLFRRGAQTGADVQIDHIVPLAYAWEMGAADWDQPTRERFANDPANLIAVDGRTNQDKSDRQPSSWMPQRTGFHCQYATQFVAVVKSYGLYLDRPSEPVLARALRRC